MASKQKIEDRRRLALDLIFQGHKASNVCRYLGITSDTLYKDLGEIRERMIKTEDYDFPPDWRTHRKWAMVSIIHLLHSLGYGDRRIAEVLHLSSSHVYRLRLTNDWTVVAGIRIQTHKEISNEGDRPIPPGEYCATLRTKTHCLLMPGCHALRYDSVTPNDWTLVSPYFTDISGRAA